MIRVELKMAPRRTLLEVRGNTFEVKDKLKENGYRWNGAYKEWHKKVENEDLEKEIEFLKSLGEVIIYPSGIRGARWLNEHGYKVKNGMVEVRE